MNMHQVYLGHLRERLWLPLKFDESHQCLLLLDENLQVSLSINGDSCLLMEVSPDISLAFWQEILVINKELAEQAQRTLAYVDA